MKTNVYSNDFIAASELEFLSFNFTFVLFRELIILTIPEKMQQRFRIVGIFSQFLNVIYSSLSRMHKIRSLVMTL